MYGSLVHMPDEGLVLSWPLRTPECVVLTRKAYVAPRTVQPKGEDQPTGSPDEIMVAKYDHSYRG